MRVTFAPQAEIDAEWLAAYQIKIEARNAKTRAIILDRIRMARHYCPAR